MNGYLQSFRRGIDIVGIHTVINYDEPRTFKEYVHRVGRTARAGRGGRAVTLLGDAGRKLLKEVVKKSGSKQVKNRIVAPDAIDYWKAKIEGVEGDVREIFREERTEKEARSSAIRTTAANNRACS